MPRILRDSLRTFSSSDDQPSSFERAGPGHDVQRQRRRERRRPRQARLGERRGDVAAAHAHVLAGHGRDLGLQPVDPGLARARRGLVRRDDQRLERELAVQRAQHRHHRQRGAVGVRDDPLGPVRGGVRVHLGDDQRHVGVHPEGAGVVDGHGPALGGDGRPLRADLVRHVEERDVHAVEDLGRERLHGDVRTPHPDDLAGRARRGHEADLAPRHALARLDDVDHRGADGARGPDDRDDRSVAAAHV